MSKMSKAIAVLGVVAGLGVAALPLSSYAADGATASKSAQVQAKVEGAISIDIVEPTTPNTGDDVSLTGSLLNLGTLKINGAPNTGAMGVRVATNAANGYSLSIKSASSATGMVGSNGAEGFTIPANAAVTTGTAGWAYKVGAGNQTAITDKDVEIRAPGAITGTDTVDNKKAETTDVTFIVAADSNTHDGTYTGTVVFTATAQD